MTSLLDTSSPVIKASSTLDRASHRKNIIDRNTDTCWASANGSPQWVSFTLPKPALLKSVSLTFQGGFVATEVIISTSATSSNSKPVATIYPQDNNFRQTFKIEGDDVRIEGAVRLEFPKSSDFFGRVVLYDLDLLGDWVGDNGDATES
ncbi:galactose-binding like protein [Calocera cornea HHB12733]|uniref:Galactose-binding like protein n=1 Tax=Calocera cornea HHB12733 TaxID=1353952 RepID=A0A165GQQ3_9BASI|nr:galactose-binding like protein [Calocera cornea HHB12733]